MSRDLEYGGKNRLEIVTELQLCHRTISKTEEKAIRKLWRAGVNREVREWMIETFIVRKAGGE